MNQPIRKIKLSCGLFCPTGIKWGNFVKDFYGWSASILINFTKQFSESETRIISGGYVKFQIRTKNFRKLYEGTSTEAPVQKLIHLAKQFQKRQLLNVLTK